MKRIFVFVCCLFINFGVVCADDMVSVTLNKCVDGDTAKFVIDGEVKTVRFLSINTPELAHYGNAAEPFGEEASKFTCDALSNSSNIKLQYDPKSDKTDKYDRVLAWVFVDDKLLQKDLINNGLAEVKYVYDDYLYSSLLEDLEATAKKNMVGMWGNSSDEGISNRQLIIYVIAIIAVVVIAIFGKSSSSKKKAIKKIKKMVDV